MTKRIPCRLNRLLKILDLLADLLQFGLAADDALGDYCVICLRSQGVEFAKNLLGDEFQCAPDRLFAAQMMGELGKMTFKSRQLFRYISAIGKERNFFQDALVLGSQRQPGFLYPFEQRRAIPFDHVRMQYPDFLKFFSNCFETVNQILGQMFALAFSHFYQICERGTESAFDCRPCIFGIQGFFREPHHPGRLQDGGDGDLAGRVQFLLQRAHRFVIRSGEFRIER